VLIYPASKSKHFPHWQALRATGIDLRADWIDAPFNATGEDLTADRGLDTGPAASSKQRQPMRCYYLLAKTKIRMAHLLSVAPHWVPASASIAFPSMTGAGDSTQGVEILAR